MNEETSYERKAERPSLLTILCILTIAWASLSVIFGLFSVLNNSPEKQMQTIEKIRESNPEMAESMEAIYLESQANFWTKYSNVFSLLFNIGSLIGAFYMWNMKRIGFHIYTISELLPYPFLFKSGKIAMNTMSGLLGSVGSGSMVAAMIMLILFDALFIILYGLNLKKMQ